ncbi:uncharacterized protein PAC_01143 [Phialocephala subalpina]|uniref:Mediator complex subunit 15 KIX domain-containing protein n=1 Tax=Phialocephala subalpina TaxID=576137 RepID=A0A1L7WEU9_9HELO|nr:uncharacterized protein PAC_01143 [Phialocephala subalpina]
MGMVKAEDHTGRLRLLVISQDEGDIRKFLTKRPLISLNEAPQHQEAVRTYADKKSAELREKFELLLSSESHITNLITARSKGEWSVLLLDSCANAKPRHSSDTLDQLSSIIDKFMDQHLGMHPRLDTILNTTSASEQPEFHRIANQIALLQSVLKKQTATEKKSDQGMTSLQERLDRRQSIFEATVIQLLSDDPERVDLSIFYGDAGRWFKCPKIQCFAFYEGFPTPASRDAHNEKHQRVSRCSSSGCLYATIGFARAGELKRHISKSHPMGPEKEKWSFPQPGTGNVSAQIQQAIFVAINQKTGVLSGWQAGVLSNERMGLTFNKIGNLRLAHQYSPDPPTLQRMIEIGVRFEKDIFEKSPNKDQYKREVAMKLEQLLERRKQNQANMQQQFQGQVRLQEQVKAQQNALQGQPGGMGPGPVPPQPSPAMPTLDAPIRATSQQQMNQPEAPQVNPNPQFGLPLDPRLMQETQRQPGPGNGLIQAELTRAMFSQMGPDAKKDAGSIASRQVV